ncbi:UDP-N-acetylmuramoyl-tripeptide--D-alanyl-D-alanine ligase [Corynebacterium anserum]|uniref:UDP-N-acetylmuramoyl-tripeptide--D-alanyl-D-alanine ligase n=1 Tax=Corynebacterium anserum TaxID=2684406 RepID=A0A7G7YMY2_9CORY|nr:UDP-N-acetylmuramoyl-tripeptide--D-alanyl-D-alanine ligase [Corynebacterium anserum]MBC2680916.1 UDP-N-acetylmuramoyl-tripeptide--D-alanyl-D-alanine ligase [Corynebacterium anserum]QNH95852.1 UDP-N-acetylmuramoyl-tripeptide--D-alanyl-D-alanine ligase [Corynebacterium anserum]
MIELTIGEIATVTGGQLINGADADAVITGPVEFDSRAITPGSIFMALPGARVDGHAFCEGALRNGAGLLLVGHPVEEPALLAAPAETTPEASNATAFEHDSDGYGAAVLAAVDRLARYNTDRLAEEEGMTVVGVTGSAGKTSTKDLIGAVLRTAGETVAPPGSFNNEIGLPYTALRAGRSTRFLVSEMSARGVGHIRHLTEVTPPHIGVVLNVGSAHLGEFGSREAIAQAKGELVEALPSDGVAVLNTDDDQVSAMESRTAARVVRYSTSEAAGQAGQADYYATNITLDEVARAAFDLHHPHGEPVHVHLGVFGVHQVSNALAAAAVGMETGISPHTVAQALSEHVAASANRMDVRTRADGVTIINDSYNANPESMRAGIEALAYTSGGRAEASSWAVLGQMGELGEEGTDEHSELGEFLGSRGVDNVIVVGNGVNQRALFESAKSAGINTRLVENIDAAVNMIDLELRPRDVVLVKASYADGLWGVAEGLLASRRIGQTEGEN